MGIQRFKTELDHYFSIWIHYKGLVIKIIRHKQYQMRCGMRVAGCGMRGTGCGIQMQDARYGMQERDAGGGENDGDWVAMAIACNQ